MFPVKSKSVLRRGRRLGNSHVKHSRDVGQAITEDNSSSHDVSQQARIGKEGEAPKNEDDGNGGVNHKMGDKCLVVGDIRTRWERTRAELIAGTLWVYCTLWILFATKAHALRTSMPWWWVSAFPSDGNRLFLFMLALTMGVWDLLTFARGTMLNPAVTVSQAMAGRLALSDAFACIVAQFAATTFATGAVRVSARVIFVNKSIVGNDEMLAAFAPPVPHPDAHWIAAAAAEAASTAALCILALSMGGGEQRPAARFQRWLVSVFVVLSSIAASSEWSGACMNPALALALAVLDRSWADHHIPVYWLSPLAGALTAAAFHVHVVDKYFPPDEEASNHNQQILSTKDAASMATKESSNFKKD